MHRRVLALLLILVAATPLSFAHPPPVPTEVREDGTNIIFTPALVVDCQDSITCTNTNGVVEVDVTGGTGDITAVGDVADGAAFNGTQGTTLTFNDAAGDQTLLYNSGGDLDFNLSDDLNINQASPHLRLTDTTASEDDYEWYADSGEVFLTNVTDSVTLLRFDGAYQLYLRSKVNFLKEAAASLTVSASTSANTAGGSLTLTAGTGTGSAAGGAFTLTSGSPGGTGNSGALSITIPNAINGNGGALDITGGDGVGTNKDGSVITILAGDSTGSSLGGALNLYGGQGGSAGGGPVNVLAGSATSGPGGDVDIQAGDASGAFVGGTINMTAGDGAGGQAGGDILIQAGLGTPRGNIYLADDVYIQAAGPNLRLDPTVGDTYGFHVDPSNSVAFINNVTDNDVLLQWDGSGNTYLPNLLNCNTLDTTADGRLKCGTDETSAGGGNSFETWAVPDANNLVADSSTDTATFTETAGLDITGNAGTDTINFAVDLTEVNTLTLGAGAFTTLTFDAGATDPVLTPGNGTLTITPGGNDLIVADDAELQDATPHLRLTDTTASQDDFELWADGSVVFLSNVTDSVQLLYFDASNNAYLPNLASCTGDIETDSSGRLACGTDGGSTTNSFSTWATPAGTNPVADSAADTVTFTETAGIDIVGTAGTDTIDFAVDLTEVSTLALGAGAFTTLTFDSGATDPVFTAGNGTLTLTPGGSDFIVADDLELQDATPHVRWTDTTGSEDDFECYADGNNFFCTNLTDAVQYLLFASTHAMTFGSSSVPSLTITTDGTGNGEVVLPTGSISGTEILDDTVTLTTDTNGNYAAGDAEAGAALTGDSATAFFSSGQIEAARGGTGIDSSSSTGVAQVSSGTWSADFTLSPGGGDLIIEDDVELQDATPHLRLTDTTGAERDFEAYADGNNLYLTDVTNGTILLNWQADNHLVFRGNSVTYQWPTVDGTNTQVLTTNGSGSLSWQDDDTGAGGGDPVLIGGTAVTDGSGVDLIGGTNGIDIAFDAGASPDTATFNLDTTEVEATTWGAGGNASNAWTFNLSGTDPVLTASSNTITVTGDLAASGIAGPDITLTPTSGDSAGMHAELSGVSDTLFYLKNDTDFLLLSTPNALYFGTSGNGTSALTFMQFVTDGTGDGEIRLPTGSIGGNEIVGGLSKCASVENLAAADDNMPLGSLPLAVTLNSVWCHCYGTCTTPATIQLEDDAGNAMTGTATCDTGGGAATPASVTAGGALVAYEGIRFDVTNTPNPDGSDEYAVCFGY